MRLLSLARDLRRRRARERQGLFVAEGVRAAEELLASGLPVRGALVAPTLDATERGAALRDALRRRSFTVLDVDAIDLASAADTDTPQGVIVIAEQPTRAVSDLVGARGTVLVLDGVQDPGNAGTMVRAAAAFGAAGVLAMPGAVDLWSAKVVRGAMGAHFRLPIAHAAWEALDEVDAELWGAAGGGETIASIVGERPERLLLAIGNEGAGLSDAARRRARRLVSIPIDPAVESLNAGVAAGVLLYELRPASLRT